MIIIISGATHTGKTNLAQKLLEKYKYPYLSIDHLKMGLIRSNNTNLTALSDDNKLTSYLWPIVREIIKTAIENNQNLIVEGCYIPYNFQDEFNENYLKHIKHCWLIMSENYINNNYDNIIKFANVIEKRLDDDLSKDSIIKENIQILENAKKHNLNHIFIDDKYDINIDL